MKHCGNDINIGTGRKGIWNCNMSRNMPKNILVCITQQKTCERLIRKAVELRGELGGNLFVIHVAKNEWNLLNNKTEGEALEYLFGISKSVGANLTVLKSENTAKTLADFARQNKINLIIMGESPDSGKENILRNELQKLAGDVEIRVVPQN